MRHFLQYWRTYNPAKELGTPLDFAASAQFKKLVPGDTLWIVAIRQQRLTLLGRLIVGKVVSRKVAIKALGNRVYDAPFVALAKAGTEEEIIEADVQGLAHQLRFNSSHDRLVMSDIGRTDGKQLQSLRELTLKASAILQSVLDSGIAQGPKSYPRKVLFARVGWMTYYAGPQTGDEKPVGGGENNKKNVGHEVFNFTDFGGKLYGFVRATNGRIKLERIDPAVGNRDRVDDVLVIFVAQQRVIGWYQGALVLRQYVPFRCAEMTIFVVDGFSELLQYQCSCSVVSGNNRSATSAQGGDPREEVMQHSSVETTSARPIPPSFQSEILTVAEVAGWLKMTTRQIYEQTRSRGQVRQITRFQRCESMAIFVSVVPTLKLIAESGRVQ